MLGNLRQKLSQVLGAQGRRRATADINGGKAQTQPLNGIKGVLKVDKHSLKVVVNHRQQSLCRIGHEAAVSASRGTERN